MTLFEAEVAAKFAVNGWVVLRNGWPDFLMVKNGKIVAVEAKYRRDRVRPEQDSMFRALRCAGLDVIVLRDGDVDAPETELLNKQQPAPVLNERCLRGTELNELLRLAESSRASRFGEQVPVVETPRRVALHALKGRATADKTRKARQSKAVRQIVHAMVADGFTQRFAERVAQRNAKRVARASLKQPK